MKQYSRVVGLVLLSMAGLCSSAKSQILYDFDFGNGADQTGKAILGKATDGAWTTNGSKQVLPSQGFTATDVNGSGAQIGYSYNSTNIYSNPSETNAPYDAATGALMQDYLFGNNATVALKLTGLTVGDAYTLVVYSAGDSGTQGGNIALTGGLTGSGSTTGASRKISAGEGVAYDIFTGIVTNADTTITVSELSGQSYTALNGIQLEETVAPEPATYALLLAGLAALVVIRRVRLGRAPRFPNGNWQPSLF